MTWQIRQGDALEELRGMDVGSVDMIFCDPPYGHNNNDAGDLISRIDIATGRGPSVKNRPIANDGPEANDLFRAFMLESFRVLRPGSRCCCCCCCSGGGPDPQFARWSLWMDEVFEFKQMVIWDKGPMGMGWHYRRSYETILVGQKPGAACKWFDDSQMIENVIRPNRNGIRKIIPSKDQHPTEKPRELAAFFIGLHSQPGELVLDPFCGSGSTGEAAALMGRNFIGIDCDPHWAGVARTRMEKTGHDLFAGGIAPGKEGEE